jgi:hypothetical protein
MNTLLFFSSAFGLFCCQQMFLVLLNFLMHMNLELQQLKEEAASMIKKIEHLEVSKRFETLVLTFCAYSLV